MDTKAAPELPNDVVRLVLCHLAVGDYADPAALAAARSVCRTWREILSAAVHTLRPTTLPDAKTAAAFPGVQRLDLSCVGHSTAPIRSVRRLPGLLPTLTAVVFEGEGWCGRCGKADLEALCSLRQLAHLSLTERSWIEYVPSDTVLPLAPHLTCLALKHRMCNRLTADGQVPLLQLTQMTQLRTLRLDSWRPHLDEAELECIAALAHSLRHLDLSGSGCYEADTNALSALTRLTALELRRCDTVSHPALARLTNLRLLVLPKHLCNVENSDQSVFHVLERLTRLQHLEFFDCRSLPCAALAALPSAEAMRTLSIQKSLLEGDLAFSAAQWSNLEVLDLFQCYGVDPQSLAAICHSLTRLTRLELGRCKPSATDRDCQLIAARLTRLRRLGLAGDGEHPTAAGVRAVMAMPLLGRLDIGFAGGGSQRPLPADGVAPAPYLTALDITGWSLDLDAAQRLAACCPQLQQLRCHSCALPDGCGSALAALTSLTALHLDVVGGPHGEAWCDETGGFSVASLAGLRQLHTLTITSNCTGSRDLARLRGIKSLRVLWCSRARELHATSFAAHPHLQLQAGWANPRYLKPLCTVP